MVEGEIGWDLGIIDAQGIETAGFIIAHNIPSLMLPVGIEWGDVFDAPPLTIHGNGCRCGKGSEYRIAHVDDGQLSVFVLHRHQVTEDSFCLIANKTVITMLRQVVMQGTPVVEQLIEERLAV